MIGHETTRMRNDGQQRQCNAIQQEKKANPVQTTQSTSNDETRMNEANQMPICIESSQTCDAQEANSTALL